MVKIDSQMRGGTFLVSQMSASFFHCSCLPGSGFGLHVPVLGFRVSGFGFRISGFAFRVSGFRFRVSGFGFRVPAFGFRGPGFESRVSGFRFRVSGFGFQVSGFGIRVPGFGFWVNLLMATLSTVARKLLTGYSQVDMLASRYKTVILGAGKSLGSPNWRAQID